MLRVRLVPTSRATTVTPDITAPWGSVTVPSIAPVGCCASTGAMLVIKRMSESIPTRPLRPCLMVPPLMIGLFPSACWLEPPCELDLNLQSTDSIEETCYGPTILQPPKASGIRTNKELVIRGLKSKVPRLLNSGNQQDNH